MADTPIDLQIDVDPPPQSKVFESACNSTENTITFTIDPDSGGPSRIVQFVNAQDWIYRFSASGPDFPVSAGQPLTLVFDRTQTIYHQRATADGTIKILVLQISQS